MLNFLKKYLKIIILFRKLARPWKLMVYFSPIWKIWTNLGYSKGKTLKFKIFFEISICFEFHLSTYLIFYVPYMKHFKKKMLLVVQNWGKKAHLSKPTTETSFGNFIYTTIVCNDNRLSWTILNFNSWSQFKFKRYEIALFTEATFTGIHTLPKTNN